MSILSVTVWLGLLIVNCQNTASWKGINVFRSTRADVERVLGSPKESCKLACDYDTKSEAVFVRYSDERCKPGDTNALDVPQHTVLSVTLYPRVKARLRDLKLDLSKFKKTKDPELQGYSTYTNVETGVTYEVSDKNMVLSIQWFGAAKDIEALRCR